MTIQPNKDIILDDSLNFHGVEINPKRNEFLIGLFNLKGISVDSSSPFETLTVYKDNTRINPGYYLEQSNFDFYFKNKLIDQTICNASLLLSTHGMDRKNFLSKILVLDTSPSKILYRQEKCPLVFHNSRIYYLILASSNCLFARNALTFSKTNFKMNSLIGMLDLRLYHADLNDQLLSTKVFENLSILILNGIVNLIQKDLFKSFLNLKILFIKTQFIRNVFQRKNKWLQHLNSGGKTVNELSDLEYVQFRDTFSLLIQQSLANQTYYDFPDEDFCYFDQFLHRRLVMPYFIPIKSQNSSCTFMFLTQYAVRFEDDIKISLNSMPPSRYVLLNYDQENRFNLNEITSESELFAEKMQTICKKESIQTTVQQTDGFYFYLTDWSLLVKYNQIIVPLILVPSFCLICLAVNLVSAWVLTRIPKNSIYHELTIHYYFTATFVGISFLKLFYVCNELV